MTSPFMMYYGPWGCPGHHMFHETGAKAMRAEVGRVPWNGAIDGVLQPGCYNQDDHARGWTHDGSPENEGEALLHHKDGWTAISFWDRTIDKRYGCNSTYIAEGIFTFEQMVEMAKVRFAERWNKMKFQVALHKPGE